MLGEGIWGSQQDPLPKLGRVREGLIDIGPLLQPSTTHPTTLP